VNARNQTTSFKTSSRNKTSCPALLVWSP